MGLLTMISLVLMAKLGAALLMGAPALPGGSGRYVNRPTVGTSQSGLPNDGGPHPLTPIGIIWSRITRLLTTRTARVDDQEDEGTDASVVMLPRPSHPPR